MICYMIVHEDKALWAARHQPALSWAEDELRSRVPRFAGAGGGPWLGLTWEPPAPGQKSRVRQARVSFGVYRKLLLIFERVFQLGRNALLCFYPSLPRFLFRKENPPKITFKNTHLGLHRCLRCSWITPRCSLSYKCLLPKARSPGLWNNEAIRKGRARKKAIVNK